MSQTSGDSTVLSFGLAVSLGVIGGFKFRQNAGYVVHGFVKLLEELPTLSVNILLKVSYVNFSGPIRRKRHVVRFFDMRRAIVNLLHRPVMTRKCWVPLFVFGNGLESYIARFSRWTLSGKSFIIWYFLCRGPFTFVHERAVLT